MLALKERGLVPAHRPIKPVRGIPPLHRRHALQHSDLFRTGFFLRQSPKFGHIANGSIPQLCRARSDLGIVGVEIGGVHKTTLPLWRWSVNLCLVVCAWWCWSRCDQQCRVQRRNRVAIRAYSKGFRPCTGRVRRSATNATRSSQQTLRLRQRFIQLAGVLAAAAGVFGFAAALAADDRCDLLDDFAGLHLRGEVG